MSTVSIVIPSYNDAEMLRGCLAALAVQTRPPDELIVVDNGSTDATAAIARAAGARVVTEPRRGVLRATAAGFDAAGCEVIGRLDADSRPAPDWTARVAAAFEADATLHALTGTGSFYGCGRFWRFVGRYLYLGGYFWSMGMLMGHRPLFGSNFAIRRTAWRAVRERAHVDDPHVHDDLDISFILDPDMGVDYDRALLVQVSARPFANVAGFQRRASWAFHDIALNLREVGVLRRRAEGARGRRRRRARQAELAGRAAASDPA
ncbi:glycosyltransferase family A protein [Microbacterium elymi]|uniref:Glycosyltransferase family 2 protein n=1 Tax=Microbacterium elymi TaxID=2909587 RepID=A0ABY5NH81_9MICO|nr:glycosyltransferase family A protein [Microbacterium elymi]UUT34466.1 glycosyltransferase family 2 protein [Microbacterium elymi]